MKTINKQYHKFQSQHINKDNSNVAVVIIMSVLFTIGIIVQICS